MAILLAVASTSHAQITSATVYLDTPNPGNAGDLTDNAASSLMSAQFNIGSLGVDFVSGSHYDVNSFLNNPTYFNETNGFTSAIAGGTNSLALGGGGTELVLTGQTFLNAGINSFVVGHDDGVVVTMPGLPGGFGNVLDQAGPTGFTSTPFNVTASTAGEYSFTMDYAECCGAPADLLFTVNGGTITGGATPEPSSFVLMGTGMLAFAGMVRRRIMA
jgi:hypothetical protein